MTILVNKISKREGAKQAEGECNAEKVSHQVLQGATVTVGV